MAHYGRRSLGVLLACLGLFAVGLTGSACGAEFGIVPGSFVVRMLDAESNPETRAGSHPDLLIDFALEVEGTGTSVKDTIIEMPPGFGGTLSAVQQCSRQAYEEGDECPPDTQVGVIRFSSAGDPGTTLPIFQMQPAPGQLSAFVSKPGIEIPFNMELRPSDYGVSFVANDIVEGAAGGVHIELWGVPADHQEGMASQRRAFLTAPTVCGPLAFTFRVRSREEDAPWLSASTQAGPLEDCESLGFSPALGLRLSNPVADSPTGLRMELNAPEEADPSGLANAQMKDITIELPPGLTISPGGASGLTVCSDAQFGVGSYSEVSCPPSSKLGTTEFSSAALNEPTVGTIYAGEERGEERFRMFVAVPGPGIVLKFVVALRSDPLTGRLSAALRGLPQVPLDHLSMSIDGGPNSLLASPLSCGPTSAAARFVPYGGGAPVESTASVTIASVLPGLSCPGPLPFAPEVLVDGSTHKAGRPSSLSVTLRRRDGEQLPARFSMTLPAGLSAALGAVRPCPEAAADSGACPAVSRLGSARAEVGSGSHPAVLRGDAFLAGSYRRAPFSLVMAFHVAIGSFDLGTIVFRSAAQLNGRTGRVTVSTDRLSDQVEGVATRFKAIEFDLDRPGLIHNPTSCGPHAIDATIVAQGGASVTKESPFSVNGCKGLGFKPRVRAVFTGGASLREQGAVGFRVSTHLRRGDTGLRAIKFSLPQAVKFGVANLKQLCSRRDATEGLCPAGSRIGTTSARSALLSKPLQGSIYVVQPKGVGQPDIWVSLTAMGVHLSVRGTSTFEHGRLVTKLAGLPDVPLSEFTMLLGKGKDSILSLDTSPCVAGHPRRLVSTLTAIGQDGARRSLRLPIEMNPRCAVASGR